MDAIYNAFPLLEGRPYLVLFSLALAYTTAVAVYRLHVHPLSAFPGPKIAAITGWYMAYYDVYKVGKFVEQLEALHELYGPVVRIGPNKLHFAELRAFDAIYTDRRFKKDAKFYDPFLTTDASFGLIDIKDAKARRDMLGSFFSRKSVMKLEGVIQDTVNRFILSLSSQVASHKAIALPHAFGCISMEVISAYCFAQRYDAINYPNYAYPAMVALRDSQYMITICHHFPFVGHIVFGLPEWLLKVVSPDALAFPDYRKPLDRHIDRLLDDPSSLDQAEHDTIFHHMLNPESGNRLPTEKSLKGEASTLIGAGTETVANTCATAAFHVLSNKDVKDRLKKELVEAWPDVDMPMPLEKLEKLPYLSAVIHETFRFSHGVTAPLPRIVPEPTEIAGVTVPKGTIVHMAATFVHRNPDVFPDPFTFRPERWLEKGSSDLLNYEVVFSKGPRMCLGINLAWAELYLILGNVFRKVEMEIVDTTLRDLEFAAFLVPRTKRPIKARIHKVEGTDHFVNI